MKNLKIISLLLLFGLLYSCQKEEKAELAEVSFGIMQIESGTTKDGSPDYIICPTDDQGNLLEPTIAEVVIDGDYYYPKVYYVGDKLHTESIKLEPGDYSVTKFVLLDKKDGEMIMAVPGYGSTFGKYVNVTTPFDIKVTAHQKTQVDVEVLCYNPFYYDDYGFNWFEITEIVVRTFCFYGEICVDEDDYEGSPYEDTDEGVDDEMPAIFRVDVERPGPHGSSETEKFYNFYDGKDFTDQPLCVTYPDRIREHGEEFTFSIWILVKGYNGWEYQEVGEFIATDDGPLSYPSGTPVYDKEGDGVFFFTWGDCDDDDDDADINF